MRDAAHDQVRDPRGPAHRDDVDDGDGDQCPQGHRGDELRGGEQVSSPGVLWRVFYLAPAVAGWGWLIVVCSPASMAPESGSVMVLVSSCGGGVLACSCSIGVCMPMAE